MRQHYYSWGLGRKYDRPMGLDQIRDLEGEQAWTGPYGNADRIIEDDVMGKNHGDQIAELMAAFGIAKRQDGALEQAVGGPLVEFINRIEAVEHPILVDGMDHAKIVRFPECETYTSVYAAIDPGGDDNWRIRGMILDCDISVSKHWRGLGIGSALVAAQLLEEGGLQVWEHDKHGFTTAGKACALRGLHLAQKLCEPWCEMAMEP